MSLAPPLILFSLGNYSSNYNIFFKSKYLSINILSKKQKRISELFSLNNPISNKIEYFKGRNNTYLLKDCIANIECKSIEKIRKGDHTIFICKVLNVKYDDKLKPLYYFNSKYY